MHPQVAQVFMNFQPSKESALWATSTDRGGRSYEELECWQREFPFFNLPVIALLLVIDFTVVAEAYKPHLQN